ncbi:MAG: ATP-binding protein [Labilithrix sp.]|nr:ATP-binding protein [Labilithrix sp.]
MIVALTCAAMHSVSGAAFALDDGGADDAGSDADGAPARRSSSQADRVRDLVAGSLDVGVSPSSLFDAKLEDPASVALDAARIRALLRGAGDGGQEPDASFSTEAWDELLDLERTRLAFYELPSERRAELLEAHARKVARSLPKETDQERKTREAEEERARALEAAQRAQSEAERLVAEELARLLTLSQSLDATEHRLASEEQALASRQDAMLGWQRRVREAKAGGEAQVDATYDALRRAMRATRDELDVALDTIDRPLPASDLGPDPLEDVPAGVDTSRAQAKRRELVAKSVQLQAREREVRAARLDRLVKESELLNRERLGLLDSLSASKRSALTGFDDEAWDQARSELRQLTLIARYHRFVATSWVKELRGSQAALGTTVWHALKFLVPALVVFLVFSWWRRNARVVLQEIQTRLEEADRAARVTAPSLALRAFRFVRAIRRPLEGLLLFSALMWLLPSSTRELLEVWLVETIVTGTLAGALVVNVINASFVAPAKLGDSIPAGAIEPDALRLRSLRLIGRVVVAFVLILAISARLVDKGAIYSWVLSTCWLAAIPIALVLVRWWRPTVLSRIELARKKSPLQLWVLAHRTGWMSFLAATVAATHLFFTAGYRTVRSWLTGIDLARRGAAYLFRRELDRRQKERAPADDLPLPEEVHRGLGPARPVFRWVSTPVDEALDALCERVREGRGGVIAVVGERGAGKSAALSRIAERAGGCLRAACSREAQGLEAIRARLADLAGLPPATSLDAIGASLDEPGAKRAVLLDDAHVHVRTVIGGLEEFDALVAVARSHSRHALWVLSFDECVWQFLSRARGIRPLFDGVVAIERWSEERIGELIESRSTSAGFEPSFDGLLDALPAGADEIDKEDALRERRTGFYRLLWDYARGNPGVALHAWRSNVGIDKSGTVHVRDLRTPNAGELEDLPYPTLFVLRAALQLAPASAGDIGRATQLTDIEVSDAIRYSVARGYLEERAGRVDITWDWFRPITRILQRRHLLVLR